MLGMKLIPLSLITANTLLKNSLQKNKNKTFKYPYNMIELQFFHSKSSKQL